MLYHNFITVFPLISPRPEDLKRVRTFKQDQKALLGTFLLHLKALTNCKVSEKSNKPIPRKSVPHIHTDGQTRLLRYQ